MIKWDGVSGGGPKSKIPSKKNLKMIYQIGTNEIGNIYNCLITTLFPISFFRVGKS